MPADQLTAKNLGPTPMELFSLMHLTTCDLAVRSWKDHWTMCPVCCQVFSKTGTLTHKFREENEH